MAAGGPWDDPHSVASFVGGHDGASPEAGRARKILDKGLADNNPEARERSCYRFKSLQGATDETFSQFDIALNDKDVNVRLAACAGLTALKDNRSIPLLEKALKDKVPEVSFSAAKALFEMDQPLGKEVLLDIFSPAEKKRNPATSQARSEKHCE